MWSKMLTVAGVLAAALASANGVVGQSVSDLLVETAGGMVQGTIAANGAHVFLGIPYAQPPVGALRFRAPRRASPWTGVHDASAYKPACMQVPTQSFLPGFDIVFPAGVSEDCLYMNVYKPSNPASDSLPVVFYLDDKSWVEGTADSYELHRYAENNNVVVVNANIRKNTFGAFNLPGFESTDSNAWFGDEEMALEWNSANIRKFGGNPSDVTIMGSSRGGSSALHHIEAQGHKSGDARLFSKAVFTSALVVHPTIFQGQAASLAHAASLGCTGDSAAVLACMQALPAEMLITYDGRYQAVWGPGTRFPVKHTTAFRNGTYDKEVKMIIGHNKNEGDVYIMSTHVYLRLVGGVPPENVTIIAPSDPAFPDGSAYASIIYLVGNVGISQTDIFGILGYYTISMPGVSIGQIASTIIHDGTVCGIDSIVESAVAHGSKVYRFEFGHAPDFPMIPQLGCTHQSELPFTLGAHTTGSISNHLSWSPEEEALSAYLQGEFAGFAKTDSPSPEWKRFKTDDPMANYITKSSPNGITLAPMTKVAACDAVWAQHL